MIRRIAAGVISVALIGFAALTLWLIMRHSSDLVLSHASGARLGLMVALVACATLIEMPLEGDSLSLGFGGALLALLILGQPGDLFSALAVIGSGALIGGAIRAIMHGWQSGRRLGLYTLEVALSGAAQLILALAAGGMVYLMAGGVLPLTTLNMADVLPLIGLIGSSLIVYVAIYALRLTRQRANAKHILAENRYSIAAVLGVPVSLAL